MVALLTPDFSAIASMLVASMPRSPNSSSAAARTLACACWLGVLAMSDLDLRERVTAQPQEHRCNRRQCNCIGDRAEVRGSEKRRAQAVYTVGKRIDARDRVQYFWQIVERE